MATTTTGPVPSADAVAAGAAAADGRPLSSPQSSDPLLFEAVVVPHRSLSARGRRVLAAVILGLSGIISAGLWYLGAWPVLGFNGIEIGLALWLLRHNARDCTTEIVSLSESGLRIARTDGRGRRQPEQAMPAGWLQVVLEERPGRTPLLLLTQRGTRVEVGAVLGEAEKRELAEALRTALHRWRNPRFDNPQLT